MKSTLRAMLSRSALIGALPVVIALMLSGMRHFRDKPTLAAMGPAKRVPGLAAIAETLAS